MQKELKSQNFKERAAEQREKIVKVKQDNSDEPAVDQPVAVAENSKPAEPEVEKLSEVKQQKRSQTASSKRPAWALTEK